MKSTPVPDVETLKSDKAYRLVMELNFQEMIPFVLTHIRKRGILSLIYAGVNLAFISFVIVYILQGLMDQSITWRILLGQSFTGIVTGTVFLIPIHELLHGLAYRFIGAKKIHFGVDFQQFIFFVTTDRYPVSRKQLVILALTPFLVINLITVTLTLLYFRGGILFSAFLLLSHNVMCVGDFAIANFMCSSKREMYTFDETEDKKSYFYEKTTEGP